MQKSFLLKLISGVVVLASTAMAGTVTFNYSGNFTADDGEAFINFTLGQGENVTAFTSGGSVGGFWSILTTYENTGGTAVWPLINGSGCGAGLAPLKGGTACDDAGGTNFLVAGAYTMVLTQDGNTPNGGLIDGFAAFGLPTFSSDGLLGGGLGGNGCALGTMYCDGSATNDASNWALTIKFDTANGGGSSYDPKASYNTTVNGATPEPGTVLLSLSGLAGLIAVRRKRA